MKRPAFTTLHDLNEEDMGQALLDAKNVWEEWAQCEAKTKLDKINKIWVRRDYLIALQEHHQRMLHQVEEELDLPAKKRTLKSK